MPDPFATASHTIILSDVHLCDAEPVDPRRPLWKRFKQRDLFIDASFARFLNYLRDVTEGPVELIFNGDLFEFDAITALPDDPSMRVTWLERRRGLAPQERKSLWKFQRILVDHAAWFAALREFVLEGHRVLFIIGNHDLELHWPSVQQALLDALDLPEESADRVRFSDWFFVSNGDTLVQHGNQFDSYCVLPDPVHPFVKSRGVLRLRKPFGDIAGRFMLNGMGLFNPFVEETFIKSPREYVAFFVKYVMRVQPLLLLSWFWSSLATFLVSVREGLLPAVKDPLHLDDHIDDIARRANAEPRVVRTLQALPVHAAIFNPWRVAQELWLDRALVLALAALVSFQLYSAVNVAVSISIWWWVAGFALLLPGVLYYASSVQSDILNTERSIHRRVATVAQAAGVRRVVLGHTHRERHTGIGGVELLNTGTWSPAYNDVECTEPYGRKCFAWIKPDPAGEARIAELRVWKDPGSEVFLPDAPPRPRLQLRRPGAVTAQ